MVVDNDPSWSECHKKYFMNTQITRPLFCKKYMEDDRPIFALQWEDLSCTIDSNISIIIFLDNKSKFGSEFDLHFDDISQGLEKLCSLFEFSSESMIVLL